MVSFNGATIGSWDHAVRLVRSHGPGPVKLGIVRDDKPVMLDVTLIAQDPPRPRRSGEDRQERRLPRRAAHRGHAAAGHRPGHRLHGRADRQGGGSIVNLPEKMAGVWHAAFSGEERDPEGPVGVIGAGRMGGEILASDLPDEEKIAVLVNLLAGFNIAIVMMVMAGLLVYADLVNPLALTR